MHFYEVSIDAVLTALFVRRSGHTLSSGTFILLSIAICFAFHQHKVANNVMSQAEVTWCFGRAAGGHFLSKNQHF